MTDPELMAIEAVLGALEPFPLSARFRVLAYLADRYGDSVASSLLYDTSRRRAYAEKSPTTPEGQR